MNDNVQNTKAKIKSFRDLYAWQEGHKLVLQTYALTKKFPKDELFGIVNQMRRAAVSVTSNIAEGFSRKSYKEKSQFYSIAQGSVTELQNQFTISKDVTYITSKEFDETDAQSIRVHKILNGLIKSSKQFFLFALLLLPYSLLLIPYSASASTLTKPVNNLGLVGYWKFDEGTTTQAGDSSGHRNTGTLSGTTLPSWVSGKLGKALQFNGTNNYVSATGASLNLNNASAFTESMWVYSSVSDNNYHAIIGNSDSGTNTRYPTIYIHNQTTIAPYFGYGAGQCGFEPTNVFTGNKWHHIAVTFKNGTTYALYVDGVSVGSTNGCNSVTPASTANTVYIGKSDNFFPGTLDDVRIYTRALSAAEVLTLYKTGSGALNHSNNLVVPNGLVGLWSFDNGDMTWKSGTTGTAYDRSGNGNNGTLVSMNQSTSPTIGKIGQALNIMSGTTYITFPNISLASTPYTVSAWIYKNDTNDFSIVGGGAGGTNANAHYIIRSSKAYFGNYGADLGGNQTISPNKWYHIVFVMDSSQNKSIYVNGALDAGPTSAGGFYTSYVNYIGTSCCGGAGIGKIDDVRIYNRALSAAEIKQVYLAGSIAVNHSTNLGLTNGLVGLWSFDGKDTNWGTNTETDGSGNGNTGTLVGMSTTTSPTIGKIGQALKFKGVNQGSYVGLGSSSALDPNRFTIAAWVNVNTTTCYNYIYSNARDGGPSYNGIDFHVYCSGELTAAIWNGSAYYITSSAGTVVPGIWTHVAVTYDGSHFILYANGVQLISQAQTVDPGSPATYTSNIGGMGLAPGTYSMNGKLDDVRLYNRALSAREVKQLYNMGK